MLDTKVRYDKEETGKYKAELQDVAISINEFGGDAGSPVFRSYHYIF